MTALRRGLPPLPPLMAALPIDERGYPVPWFVAKVNGKFDFRMADEAKRWRAVDERRCWICGLGMGRELAFNIGPMCVLNRNTSEPAAHRACAEYAAHACPFMTRPKAEYRTANMPEGARPQFAGIYDNPGACAIYHTTTFRTYEVPGGGWLIRLGPPTLVQWFCEGRAATRGEIMGAIERRLPMLRELALAQGPEAEAELAEGLRDLERLAPAEVPA